MQFRPTHATGFCLLYLSSGLLLGYLELQTWVIIGHQGMNTSLLVPLRISVHLHVPIDQGHNFVNLHMIYGSAVLCSQQAFRSTSELLKQVGELSNLLGIGVLVCGVVGVGSAENFGGGGSKNSSAPPESSQQSKS